MPKRTRPYRDSLKEDLQDPFEALAYLKAASEDSPEAFQVALQDVNESQMKKSPLDLQTRIELFTNQYAPASSYGREGFVNTLRLICNEYAENALKHGAIPEKGVPHGSHPKQGPRLPYDRKRKQQ